MVDTKDAVETTRDALGACLAKCIPALKDVNYDFPDANVTYEPPSLTISHTTTDDGFSPLQPYELCRTAPGLDGAFIVKSIVGMWDFKLQLDFWTRNEPERNRIFAAFFEVFANSRKDPEDPIGLNLKLEKYHGIYARLDLAGYTHTDASEAQQQGIWRTKVTLLANTRAVLEKKVFQIKVIENNLVLLDTNQDIDVVP